MVCHQCCCSKCGTHARRNLYPLPTKNTTPKAPLMLVQALFHVTTNNAMHHQRHCLSDVKATADAPSLGFLRLITKPKHIQGSGCFLEKLPDSYHRLGSETWKIHDNFLSHYRQPEIPSSHPTHPAIPPPAQLVEEPDVKLTTNHPSSPPRARLTKIPSRFHHPSFFKNVRKRPPSPLLLPPAPPPPALLRPARPQKDCLRRQTAHARPRLARP